jgi:hypothetical protein
MAQSSKEKRKAAWDKRKDIINAKRRQLRITVLHKVLDECNNIYWSNRTLIKKSRKNVPWMQHLNAARYRCNNSNDKYYHLYGGRGICCFLDKFDILQLWLRDCAYEMKQPSIDRINSDGNYTLENCRFIEYAENSRLGMIKSLSKNGSFGLRKPILQYDLQGNFIKEWESVSEALKAYKPANIINALKRRSESAAGFVWKYKA